MATAQPVPPYLPACSSASQQDFQSGWKAGDGFELTAAYVKEDALPSAIPGFVLGGIALLGFCLTFAAVLLSLCCCCCKRRTGGGSVKKGHDTAQQQQVPPSRRRQRLASRHGRAFWALLALLALATVGVGIWGLVETLSKTDSIASDFWELVADTRTQVDGTAQAIQDLQSGAASLARAAQQLASNEQAAAAALGGSSEQAIATLVAAGGAADSAASQLDPVLNFLNNSVDQALGDLQSRFEGTTMAVQDTWRYVAAAVLYGLLIVLSLSAPLGCWFGTWPRLTALLVALLWLCVTLLMAVGTGALRAVGNASGDACLFAESYVLETATAKLAGSEWQDTALRMLRFYLGLDPAPQTNNPELAPLLAWLPSDAAATVQTVYGGLPALESQVTQLYELSQQAGAQAKLGSAVTGAIQQSSSAVTLVTTALDDLLRLASTNNSDRIYHGAKEYICCELQGSAHALWVSWTVAGCLGLVLALLCSARLVRAAMTAYKSVREQPSGPEDPYPAWGSQRNDELVSRPRMAELPPYEAHQQFASAGAYAAEPTAPPLPVRQAEPAGLPVEPTPEGAVTGGKKLHGAQQ
ncbi:hypothetical protein ABPG77_011350 [Micractinium sp. CCAP 211/92]